MEETTRANENNDVELFTHFEKVSNAQAKCKLCQKSVPLLKTTTMSSARQNLRSHLEKSHHEIPAKTPRPLFVSSTTPATNELLTLSSTSVAVPLSENSDTDTQNNSQTANNTESSDPGEIVSLLDEAAKDRSPGRNRTLQRRRIKRPSLRRSIHHINTDEDFGRLISKKMHMLPFAIRCRLEVEMLRLVNSALHKLDEL